MTDAQRNSKFKTMYSPGQPLPAMLDQSAGDDLAPMGLDQVASLGGKDADGPLEFSFEYQGYIFAVQADASEQRTNIKFRANLGSLPYTAEDPVARSSAYAVLRAASQVLGGKVRLTPRQRVILLDDITVDEPFTPVVLLSLSTRVLVQAKPYLELLATFISPPVPA